MSVYKLNTTDRSTAVSDFFCTCMYQGALMYVVVQRHTQLEYTYMYTIDVRTAARLAIASHHACLLHGTQTVKFMQCVNDREQFASEQFE